MRAIQGELIADMRRVELKVGEVAAPERGVSPPRPREVKWAGTGQGSVVGRPVKRPRSAGSALRPLFSSVFNHTLMRMCFGLRQAAGMGAPASRAGTEVYALGAPRPALADDVKPPALTHVMDSECGPLRS